MQVSGRMTGCCLAFAFFFTGPSTQADLLDEIPSTQSILRSKKPQTVPSKRVKSRRTSPIKRRPPVKGKKPASAPSHNHKVSFGGNHLIARNQEGYVDLKDRVWVKQGELYVKATTARIYFDAGTKQVATAFAQGDVEIERRNDKGQLTLQATSREATLDVRRQMILLKGEAKLKKGVEEIIGELIQYNLKTGWINVKRVRGVLRK